MTERTALPSRFRGNGLRLAASMLVLTGLVAGCSKVPDAINPVEWYKGAANVFTGDGATASSGDQPSYAGKVPSKPAEGLVADRGGQRYAEGVKREVAPTKALARKQTSQDTQVAMVGQNEVSKAPLAEQGPAAPPASVDMTPPAAANVPETVPLPKGRGRVLQEHYQKRLAESASQVVRPDLVDMGGFKQASLGGDEPIHLIPPSSKRVAKGAKGLSAPLAEPAPSASFQVASLGSGPDLSATDRQAIVEIARLYKQTGGVVRVVGSGAGATLISSRGSLSGYDYAGVVGKELARQGVPAKKIKVGADASQAGTTIFIDVM